MQLQWKHNISARLWSSVLKVNDAPLLLLQLPHFVLCFLSSATAKGATEFLSQTEFHDCDWKQNSGDVFIVVVLNCTKETRWMAKQSEDSEAHHAPSFGCACSCPYCRIHNYSVSRVGSELTDTSGSFKQLHNEAMLMEEVSTVNTRRCAMS